MRASVEVAALQSIRRTAWGQRRKICVEYNAEIYKIRICCLIGSWNLVGESSHKAIQHCKVLDTEAFDIVIRKDFLCRQPQVKLLSLQRPYALHCHSASSLFSVPLGLSGQTKIPVYATWTGLIELETTSSCDPSSKMDWPPCR